MTIKTIKTVILVLLVLLNNPVFAQEPLTQEEVFGWFETLSNWGRWGVNDQLGTVNNITEETRVAAAGLVETGVSVSMAHEILTEVAADNGNPYDHRMTSVGSSPGPWSGDFIGVSYHGYAHSHLDALCHRFQFGTMYNGYSEDEVTEAGCAQLAITSFANGIFGRGIVMDFPRLRGVD